MKQQQELKLRMLPDFYYVWCGGSCDYGHAERYSGGAYIMQKDEEIVETYTLSEEHTTEFRMILSVMIHALEVLPAGSDIVFLTNASYIQQNFDKMPTDKSANADLISRCIALKEKHHSLSVKIVPFHKYPLLPQTHEMAHEAMKKRRG
jgi:ribonuclease HI